MARGVCQGILLSLSYVQGGEVRPGNPHLPRASTATQESRAAAAALARFEPRRSISPKEDGRKQQMGRKRACL